MSIAQRIAISVVKAKLKGRMVIMTILIVIAILILLLALRGAKDGN